MKWLAHMTKHNEEVAPLISVQDLLNTVQWIPPGVSELILQQIAD